MFTESLEALEDKGLSTLLKLKDEISELVKDKEPVKVKVEPISSENSEANQNVETKSRLEIHRLREFKINGSVGNPGQKDTLSYTSLSFQLHSTALCLEG